MTAGNNDNGAPQDMPLSIWLLPSPQEGEPLTKMIAEFSQHEAASVPFQPHVTVVGGIPCSSMDHFRTTLFPRLREGIQKAIKSMTCRFSTEPVYKDKWNQACVLVMEESDEFKELVQLCRTIALDDSGTKDWYPPPLGKPHLSLYYGTEGAPSPQDVAQGLGVSGPSYSFQATRVAVWISDPPTSEGVGKWAELGVIDLPGNCAKSSL